MKTAKTILIAALASIAMFAFTSPALAQYKAVGDDGIAASPKHRQHLNEYRKNHTTTPAPAKSPQMACAMCKDKVTSRIDYSARGANKPTIRVVTHLCESCGTDWALVGHGKAKQSVPSHKCTSCGEASLACCNTSKGSSVATKGMEKAKNYEVAPLK